jgi:hypothetical protein
MSILAAVKPGSNPISHRKEEKKNGREKLTSDAADLKIRAGPARPTSVRV